MINAYGAIAELSSQGKGVKKKKNRKEEREKDEKKRKTLSTKRDYYPRKHALLMRLIAKQSN